MRKHFIRKSIIEQMICFRENFAQKRDVVFGKILSVEYMVKTLRQEGKIYRNRLFSPVVTLQYFLYQTLSADHSCQDVVSQRMAEALKEGSKECSSNTASYCVARKKLPLKWVMGLMRKMGKKLHEKSLNLWRGRSIKLIDGTTVSMPDTGANQKEYPQVKGQKAGIGFPIARMVGIISLNCGAVLDIALGAYEGKGTGEHTLLRRMMKSLKKTMWCWQIDYTPAIG